MEHEYYWQLIERDGTTTDVPPKHAPTIQKRLADQQVINFSTRSIPHHQVTKFAQSDKIFTDQKLLAEAAQAFRSPIIVNRTFPDGTTDVAVQCRWVKRNVTNERYDKYYSKQPGYHKLRDYNSMAVIAYVVPTHQVNTLETEYCTPDEIKGLTKR